MEEEGDYAYLAEIGVNGGTFVKYYEQSPVDRRALKEARRFNEETFFPAYVLGLVKDGETVRLAFATIAIPVYGKEHTRIFPLVGTVNPDDIIAYHRQVGKYLLDMATHQQEGVISSQVPRR